MEGDKSPPQQGRIPEMGPENGGSSNPSVSSKSPEIERNGGPRVAILLAPISRAMKNSLLRRQLLIQSIKPSLFLSGRPAGRSSWKATKERSMERMKNYLKQTIWIQASMPMLLTATSFLATWMMTPKGCLNLSGVPIFQADPTRLK